MHKRLWGTAALLLSIAFSCQKPELAEAPPTPTASSARIGLLEANQARTVFTQTLAKALVRKELRDFIRTEALKKFDLDYDVLYHAHKNRVIAEGLTLQALLASYYTGSPSFETVTKSLPKLTIFVPDFLVISAQKWDTKTVIPSVVASHPEKNNKSAKTFTAYDHQGKQKAVDAVAMPTELILVVKDNERVEVTGKNVAGTAGKTAQFFQSDGEYQYYFTHPSFNGTKSGSTFPGSGLDTPGTNDLFEDFIKAYIAKYFPEIEASTQSPNRQREWLYYKTSELNNSVVERINHLRFVTERSIADASDNWSEGNLELRITVLLGGQTPVAFQNNLVGVYGVDVWAARLSVPNFIENYVNSQQGWQQSSVRKILTDKQKSFETQKVLYKQGITHAPANDGTTADTWWIAVNTDVINWSPHRYGDVVKFLFREHDLGEIVKTTRNYEVGFNASYGKKDTFNIGLTGKVSGSTEVTYTNASDDLGEQFVYWAQPVGVTRAPYSAGGLEFRMQALVR